MSDIAQGEANGIRWTVEASPADKRFAVVHLYRDGQKINFHVFGPETVPAVQAALAAYHAQNNSITIPMDAPDSGVDSAIYAAKLRAENADLRATVERLTREVAALRLMLREVASTNSTGIDYALGCQRERDEAVKAAVEQRERYHALCGKFNEMANSESNKALRADRDKWRELFRKQCRDDSRLIAKLDASRVSALRRARAWKTLAKKYRPMAVCSCGAVRGTCPCENDE